MSVQFSLELTFKKNFLKENCSWEIKPPGKLKQSNMRIIDHISKKELPPLEFSIAMTCAWAVDTYSKAIILHFVHNVPYVAN